MKWNKKFKYPNTVREMVEGQRHYNINNEKLPSVTTILGKTQTAEKQQGLANWRARVGEEQATRTMNQAAARGSAMHAILEHHILGKNRLDMTDTGQQAHKMAAKSGASRIDLETAFDNINAQALYESLGYEKDNEFYKYSLEL